MNDNKMHTLHFSFLICNLKTENEEGRQSIEGDQWPPAGGATWANPGIAYPTSGPVPQHGTASVMCSAHTQTFTA